MEAQSLLVLGGVIAGGAGMVLSSSIFLDYLDKRMRRGNVRQRIGAGGLLRRILRRGIVPLRPCCDRIVGFGAVGPPIRKMVSALRVQGFDSDEQSLCSLLVVMMVLLAGIGWFAGSWESGLAFGTCSIIVLSAWSSHVLDRYRDSVRDALPDALRAMSACFHAGYTLQQTFEQLDEELPRPLARLFGSARDAMKTGATASEALASLREGGIVSELSFVSVALEVQHRAGGSMRHVLEAARDSLESELELRRSLKVQTAQARLSTRVVTGVSIGLVGVLSLLSENFLGPFFASVFGFALLVCAVAMQVTGIMIVRRMLQVEVD